jgi:hypothetical protein
LQPGLILVQPRTGFHVASVHSIFDFSDTGFAFHSPRVEYPHSPRIAHNFVGDVAHSDACTLAALESTGSGRRVEAGSAAGLSCQGRGRQTSKKCRRLLIRCARNAGRLFHPLRFGALISRGWSVQRAGNGLLSARLENLRMDENQDRVLLFGFVEEAAKFRQRHPLWVDRSQNLTGAINAAFTRSQTMDNVADKFVYFYGRMCAEDFNEILLVCGNGYGAAGMKLLRSMYEHTVTLRYLHDNPEEVENFMDYHRVQQYKLTKPIFETFGRTVLSPEIVAEVERRYAEVRDKFMVTACECGAKRVNHTWSKLDFVSMAKKTGALGTLIVHGYFLPLRHAHTTFGGLTERLEIVNEQIGFQHESQPEMADTVLMTAHNCLLAALEVQNERFNISGLGDKLQTCLRDWAEIWTPDSELLKDAPDTIGRTD